MINNAYSLLNLTYSLNQIVKNQEDRNIATLSLQLRIYKKTKWRYFSQKVTEMLSKGTCNFCWFWQADYILLSNRRIKGILQTSPADCRKIAAVDVLDIHGDWNRKRKEEAETDQFFSLFFQC